MDERINGKTSVYGLIGNPVSHSLSPAIHNALSRITGINSVYVTFPVMDANALKAALDGAYALGIQGMNVTIPYKKDVIPFLCDIDENAERIGAVNTLKITEKGYKGYNSDIIGVYKTLKKHDVDLGSQSLLLLGAGGGSYASAFAAVLSGVKRIYIANRTKYNSELLASRLKKYYNTVEAAILSFDELSVIKDKYFIIQTTSVSMDSNLSPVSDIDIIRNSSGVFDIVYSPLNTKILLDAESVGKPVIGGIDMLIYQAICAFEIWNGVEVDKRCVAELFEYANNLLYAKREEK